MVRDRVIAEAAERRLCPESGRIMTSVLKLVDAQPGTNGNDNHDEDDGDKAVNTVMFAGPSQHFSHAEIERQVASDHGADSVASVYLDQYLR